MLMVLLLATAITVPPQFVPSLGLLETVKPAGNVSLKAIPLSDGELGLLMIMFKLESPPERGMLVGVKEMAIVGGEMTLMEALDVFPLPPSVEVTSTLLSLLPCPVPVTFTLKLQEALAPSVPAERVTEEEPAVARMPPLPQVPVKPFGVDTTMPGGSESVKATPLNGEVEFGLEMENVSDVDELRVMEDAPNVFVMGGGETVPVPVTPRV